MELVPRDVPEPALKPDSVLVKMRAVALNRGEFVSGYGLHAPGSVKTAGYEGAGEIIAVGANVKDSAPGVPAYVAPNGKSLGKSGLVLGLKYNF